MVKILWRKLFNIGITPDIPYEVARRIRLQNQVSILVLLSTVFFAALNVFQHRPNMAMVDMLIVALQCFSLYLNHKRKYILSSILLYAGVFVGLAFFCFYLSHRRDLEYLFIITAISPLIFYKDKAIIYSLLLLSVIFFSIAKILAYGWQDIDMYLNYSLIFLMSFFTVKYLKDEFENYSAIVESQNLQLKKLNEEKNQLISIASHDLRSPLNRIQSLLSLLSMEGSLTHEQQEILRTTQQEAKQQTEMISEILDVYAMDEGRNIFTLEKVEIPTLIIELVKSFQSTANKKNIKIQIESKADRIQAFADKAYLNQVFENLLSNALKFSYANSQIVISLRSSPQTMIISFKDEGQGLDAEDMKKLFKRFQRLSARPTAGETSSGLGLSIAKKYTEAMKGSLTCVSEKGKGATFTVELPLA